MEFIFVYGTLRSTVALPNKPDLLAGGDYCADGYIFGKLYAVDDYPGAIDGVIKSMRQQQDKVFGELYRIADDALLACLDDYEECTEKYPRPHEFLRKALPVHLISGETVLAWVYIYNRDTANLGRISSGDYCCSASSV